MSKMSPMPAPRAVISVLISSLPSILSRRAFSTLRILPRSGRMAWKRRSRPCLAVPPARVALDDVESRSGPGRAPSSRPACRAGCRRRRCVLAHHFARLAGGVAGAGGGQALLDDACARRAGSLPGTAAGPRRRPARPRSLTSALPSLSLVWPSNCGFAMLDADDGGQALAHVVAGQVGVVLLEDAGSCGRSR